MPIQTTYSQNIAAAVAGMLANQEHHEIISRNIEDAAGVGFGKVVLRGAADLGIIKPAAGASAYVGITVRNPAVDGGGDLYPQYSPVSVLRRGVIWVTAGEAVAAGDAALYNDTTGAIVKTAGAGVIAIPGGKFELDAANGALVPLRIDL